MRDYASYLPVNLAFDLYQAGWSGSTEPYPGIDKRDFAMVWLRKSLLKKFSKLGPNVSADKAALSLFLKNNEACRNFQFDFSSMTTAEATALGEAKNWIYSFFFPNDSVGEMTLSFWKIADGFDLGNGANLGSPGTDFLSKVGLSDLSATDERLYCYYTAAVLRDPLWSDVESIREGRMGHRIVRGSRLSFVPKTTEISRTICTEPVLNMIFQKGIASVLERQLEHTCGIRMDKQPDKNRVLARIGSRNGRFGTIDLSSASDTISLSLVRWMLPPDVVRWLELTRCTKTILPDGSELDLHMVSSMGNAFTFPLQTLLFTSLVYAAYRILGIPITYPHRSSLGNFAVFGDDIIVDKKAYNLLCRLLMLCGFSVNIDKSFNDGLFRESCGRDYYDGYNVRGVYIKSLNDVNDVYSAINRLNFWSAQHGIPLPNTVGSLLAGTRYLPVPRDEADTAGVKVPMSCFRGKVKRTRQGSFIYRASAVRTHSVDVSMGESRKIELKGWFPNYSAVLLSALAGKLRNGSVSIRMYRRSSRLRRHITPRWEWYDTYPLVIRDFDRRWKTMVEANLTVY